MILSLIGSHSSKHIPISLEITIATPRWCSFSHPEYTTVSPVVRMISPDLVHLHSLTPQMPILYLSISLVSWSVFPVWYKVLTFQHAILETWLGPSIDGFGPLAGFRLSPKSVLLPWWSINPCTMVFLLNLFLVSVAGRFLREWGANPLPTLLLSKPGLGPATAKFDVSRHQRTVHWSATLQCGKCEVSFSRKDNYMRHIKSHPSFDCFTLQR